MLKACKYRMYPTKEQEEKFFQHFGACRFIYNWGLEQKIKTYEQDSKSISRFDLNKGITMLKRDGKHDWLKEVNSQSLQGATLNLDNAFTKFFREKKGFPKFKSRKNPVQAYNVPQNYKVDIENNRIYLPKIGNVKTILHRSLGDGDLKTATVSRTSTGKYYISILVDDNREFPEKSDFSVNDTVGVDVGIKNFAITSNGDKIDNPRHLKNSMEKLKVLSKRLSRKQKGSKNRNKARQQVAKFHEKIRNQRHDFQHKVSTKLVSENQAIAVETLNVSGMLKNHCLAQHITDASWASFITKLEYKAEWYGKTILRIGRFEPSTKICNVCGFHNSSMTLADRKWKCPECNANHDRDINASINIKKFALQEQNLIGM
ncbi:IS200/IS605 family element RNA-guided endonuclease TnpB [Methanolobus halotolerans]|uniref:Transposase n=1 Tax=Methanolobus halotolerans TaxID=2052935 RepID=A0A4E0PWA8_9EURY|nr:IS200/IS605 family element RNA-guided endonuclease TnpB [Methanolobus halotolerans]TGC09745.1 transposase [Methanolobus halotolerans]